MRPTTQKKAIASVAALLLIALASTAASKKAAERPAPAGSASATAIAVAAALPASTGTPGAAVPRASDTERFRALLGHEDLALRVTALRGLRAAWRPELEGEVAQLAEHDPSLVVRRVAVQVLALHAAKEHRALFLATARSKDEILQINARYGLARCGDAASQAWLLETYDASCSTAPPLSSVLLATIEDPSLRSPAIVERFVLIANDTTASAELREHATNVLRRKRAPL